MGLYKLPECNKSCYYRAQGKLTRGAVVKYIPFKYVDKKIGSPMGVNKFFN
jgi:hypothetical protein